MYTIETQVGPREIINRSLVIIKMTENFVTVFIVVKKNDAS